MNCRILPIDSRITTVILLLLAPTVQAEDPVDFSRDIKPILARNCFLCHGPDESTRKGGIRLDTFDAALTPRREGHTPPLVPGDPDASAIIRRITALDPEDRMPPEGRVGLSPSEIEMMRRWVAGGGTYASHWSWNPLHAPPVPPVENDTWPRYAIDSFLLARLEKAGLYPAPPADPAVLLRRLSYDLTGLPPTDDDLDRFLARADATAWEQAVDRLLASPRFGEHWARHWLDLVRYAETCGHEFDYPIPHAWKYRDYIIRAFNEDLPYDSLVREHIAGDLLEQPRLHPEDGYNESIIGTGFWFLDQGTHAPVDVRQDEADHIENQIDVFTKSFLGLTVSCARCHDHKFDAITTRDYYSLAGVFRSSRRQDAYLDPGGTIRDAVRTLAATREQDVPLISRLLPTLLLARKNPLAPWLHAAAMVQENEGNSLAAVSMEHELDADRLGRWVDALNTAHAQGPSHPLWAWARVARGETKNETPVAVWQEVASPPSPEASRFTVFNDRTFQEWHITGMAFGGSPSSPGDVRFDDGSITFTDLPCADSARIDRTLQGTLRSRTFEIEHDWIHYRVQGNGGRIRVIIDGYILNEYNALLFEDMDKRIEKNDNDGWVHVRQFVGRYRGHRAHIALMDDGPGSLQVHDIWFSNSDAHPAPAPPWQPSGATASGAGEPIMLDEVYNQAFREAVSLLRRGHLDTDSVVLLAVLLNADLLPPDPANIDAKQHLGRRQLERENHTAGIPPPLRVLAIADGTPEDEFVFIRGNHRMPGESAPRSFIDSLSGGVTVPFERGSGRLELADAILSPANPLVDRVIVNRVWHHLFGRGIVPSTDDFGAMGIHPTHPELLDHLAAWFRDDAGRSIKSLIRRIVTSTSYRMSSLHPDPELCQLRDPSNGLLHRSRIRRRTSESVRDSILAVSGQIDATMYGPPVPVHLTEFMTGRGRPGQSGPLDGKGRRSIYIELRRNFLSPMMLAFDTPTPFTTTGTRSVSSVPAQALMMMNDPFIHQQASHWAGDLLARTIPDADRVDHMYRTALGRSPTEDERNRCLSFLTGEDPAGEWTDLCHVVFNMKEFLFLY